MTTSDSTLPGEFKVKITPRSSRSEIVGWSQDILRVRLQAPPVDGRANAALIDLLAQFTGRPKSAIRIVQGARSRVKRVRIASS